MRKLRLKLDDLAVESFGTADPRGRKPGTVHGHYDTSWEGCGSGASECQTCRPFGCAQDTVTCFAGCGTNYYQICIE